MVLLKLPNTRKDEFSFNVFDLFLNWPTQASFSFIFGLFKQTIQFLQQINVKNVMSIQYKLTFEIELFMPSACEVVNKTTQLLSLTRTGAYDLITKLAFRSQFRSQLQF